jgi:hypothetical protein
MTKLLLGQKTIIKYFINETILNLLESSRYEKEIGRVYSDDARQKLLSLASENHPTEYAFTMTAIQKVGINPSTKFETPAGVYFYPLTKEYCKMLFENRLPFGSSRKYVGLVKLKSVNSPGKWLKFIDKGTNFVTDEELKSVFDRFPDEAQKMMKSGKHKSFNNDAKVFDIGYFYSDVGVSRKTLMWTSFLRKLGLIGIYDSGNGVVHPVEPAQIVCLTPDAYEVVDIFETEDFRKIRKLFTTQTRNISEYEKSVISEIPKMSISEKISLITKTKSAIILNILSKDKSVNVRQHVAENDFTSLETLLFLTKSKNENVKIKILDRSDVHPKILEILMSDKSEHIQQLCLQNPNTPKELIINAFNNGDSYVRKLIVANPAAPEEILIKYHNCNDFSIVWGIAANPNTPKEILVKMSNSKDSHVRKCVAENLNSPKEILVKMSKDKDEQVLKGIAKNQNTPQEILDMLSKDPRSAIVSYVSANPSTSRETLMMLSKNPYAIRGVSSNPSAPQELIDTLSNHKDLYVRIGVAKNPNTSITILKKLSKDENEYVKQQAQKVLKQKNKLA